MLVLLLKLELELELELALDRLWLRLAHLGILLDPSLAQSLCLIWHMATTMMIPPGMFLATMRWTTAEEVTSGGDASDASDGQPPSPSRPQYLSSTQRRRRLYYLAQPQPPPPSTVA